MAAQTKQSQKQEEVSQALARSAIYQLLSQTLVYPTQETVDALVRVDLPQAQQAATELPGELTPLLTVLDEHLRYTDAGGLQIEDGEWAEDRNNPLYYLVRVEKVALPLYPQFGTEPNIYYIPPRWVPRPYLRQMFGPGVDQAIERYTNPSRELLAVLQLFRTTQTIIYRYEIEEGEKIADTEMFNDTIIGFDKEDNEAVRASVLEPFHVRPDKYQNSI